MSMIRLVLFTSLVAGLAVVASAGTAWAQATSSASTWDPSGFTMERAELETMMEQLNSVAASSAYSGRIRDRAERDAAAIRERLDQGDFRTGDRVVIRMEGHPNIPEELPVLPGPRISLPVWGSVSLQGVLRSELVEHLTREIGRYVQNPMIEAHSLVRLSIQGSVGNPGFYTVPADMLLGEALMHAGGPAGGADLDNIQIERTGERLWSGTELREVIAEGRTLDQMNLRAGDQIFVPAQGTSNWGRIATWTLGTTASVLVGWLTFRGRR